VPSRQLLRRAGTIAAITAAVAAATLGIREFIETGEFCCTPQTPRVVLLYVGAEDCAPCRAWQGDAKAAFQASAEFPRLSYREVKSPTLFDILKDENWPEELRKYRDQLGDDAGVPLWLVIADDRVVQRGMGPAQWRAEVFPKIKSLLR
jgi:hypothetical protein